VVFFQAEGGQQYWLRLNYEHVVSAASLRDLTVSLTMQPKGPDADAVRRLKIY
jgi:hypothetical protein